MHCNHRLKKCPLPYFPFFRTRFTAAPLTVTSAHINQHQQASPKILSFSSRCFGCTRNVAHGSTGHAAGQVALQQLLLDPQAQSRATASALGIRLCIAICHHRHNISICGGAYSTLHTLLLAGESGQELCTLDWRMRQCRCGATGVLLRWLAVVLL